MRFLLLIPILVLFFSNIPIVKEIPRIAQPFAIHGKKSCCHQETAGEQVCPIDASSGNNNSNQSCWPKNENTCLYISFFQIIPSSQPLPEYLFLSDAFPPEYSTFSNINWKDPYLSLPIKPPAAT
jgi:hypothetical protein